MKNQRRKTITTGRDHLARHAAGGTARTGA